jgi:DNA-binding CsgD family transcriptional regulator
MSKLRKGQSTHGYGKTKEIVEEAKKQNLSIKETAEKHGLSETAVRSAAIRNGIRLRNVTGRSKWGSIKEAVIKGKDMGLTNKQIAEHFKLNYESVKRSAYSLTPKKNA